MKRIILTYCITEYPELGGGDKYIYFENEKDLINEINKLNKEFGEDFMNFEAHRITTPIKIKEVEKITEYKLQ